MHAKCDLCIEERRDECEDVEIGDIITYRWGDSEMYYEVMEITDTHYRLCECGRDE